MLVSSINTSLTYLQVTSNDTIAYILVFLILFVKQVFGFVGFSDLSLLCESAVKNEVKIFVLRFMSGGMTAANPPSNPPSGTVVDDVVVRES